MVWRSHVPGSRGCSARVTKLSLVISMVVLFALKVFWSETLPQNNSKVQIMPTWTDHRGNGSALDKPVTTRYSRERSTYGAAGLHEADVCETIH